MPDTSTTATNKPSTATIALIAAGVIAAASAAVAISRSGGDEPAAPVGPHAGAVEGKQAGSIEEMVARIEGRLKQNPDNPADWRMLGWSYYEMREFARAANAYRRAAELEPNNAENWSSLGEALQVSTQQVAPEAVNAFDRALKIDPKDPRARYFRAVQRDLSGEHQQAVDDWLSLLRDTPAGAPWEADLRRTIAQAAEKNKIDIAGKVPPAAPASSATAAIPGPTRDQMAAASAIPPGQQDEMVRGMVDRLAGRLKANPRDAEGWIRLMRARMVLGETEAATAALRTGLATFKGDKAVEAQLARAAAELGVPSGG